MSKYEKHYRASQTSDLLRKLLEHKLQTQPLGKEWAEALVLFLQSLNLQDKERQIFVSIQDSSSHTLIQNAEHLHEEIDALIAAENKNNPLTVDPLKIADAGRSLKMTARIAAVFIIVAAILGCMLLADPGQSTRQTIMGVLLFGGLIANLLILALIHNTGSTLHASVHRKNT